MGKHTRFLLHAAEVANASPLETKHGSILVRGGKVLGTGFNSSRSRLQSMPGESNVISLHSEVRAHGAAGGRRRDVAHAPAQPTPLSRRRSQVAAMLHVPCLLQGS